VVARPLDSHPNHDRHETTVQLLAADSAPFEAAIRSNPSNPQLAAGEGQLVAVLGPDGATVLTNLPDSLRDVYRQLKTFHGPPRYVHHDGRQFLVTNEPVTTPSGTWHVIVARSLEPGDLVLDQLSLTLIIGAVALFLIFGVASWILSGAALRPVSRMRKQAELLDREERLSGASLPVGPARDELAALALTLNDFLARNRQIMDRERQMISDASHEFSQLEAGTVSVSSAWSQLSLETSAAIDRARVLGQARHILVDFDIADADDPRDYPVAVSSFGRLIDNLLANAITASPDGSTVTLDLAQDESGLALSVTDHGPGMPEDFLPIAFDRFTRPDEARRRDGGGSGLGLAIVAAIVSTSGGRVDLRNLEPGFAVRVTMPDVG
jgi:two-component system OmpR family sensor kinase